MLYATCISIKGHVDTDSGINNAIRLAYNKYQWLFLFLIWKGTWLDTQHHSVVLYTPTPSTCHEEYAWIAHIDLWIKWTSLCRKRFKCILPWKNNHAQDSYFTYICSKVPIDNTALRQAMSWHVLPSNKSLPGAISIKIHMTLWWAANNSVGIKLRSSYITQTNMRRII